MLIVCSSTEYTTLGDAKDILNVTSDMGVDLFHAEFHADFRSGLHFNLRGCISEHKSNFQIEAAMGRFYFFEALLIFYNFDFWIFLWNYNILTDLLNNIV